MKKGRSPALRGPRPGYRSPSSEGAPYIVTLSTYRVDHAAVGRDGGLLGQRRVELASSGRLEVVDAVAVEVHAVLDYGEVAEVVGHLRRYFERPLVVDRAAFVGNREAVDGEPAGRAGVAAGGERHRDRPVGGQPLHRVDQAVTICIVGQGRALAYGLGHAMDVLGVG